MVPHVHANAVSLGTVLAFLVVAKVLVGTVAAHHSNHTLAQAAAYVFPL